MKINFKKKVPRIQIWCEGWQLFLNRTLLFFKLKKMFKHLLMELCVHVHLCALVYGTCVTLGMNDKLTTTHLFPYLNYKGF